MERLFRRKKCPKVFQWKPREPKRIFRDVVIEYAKEGWDVVVTEDEIKEAARRAEYNSEEEARIQIKRAFSFGTSTTIVKVWRTQYYMTGRINMSVVLEFGTSDECAGFIQHDIHRLINRDVDILNEDEDARTVIDDVCVTVANVALDHRHAELAAIHRGLSEDNFLDEFTEPRTQVTCHRASPADNHARPCVLMLHLEVSTLAPHDRSFIWSAHWSATDSIPNPPSLPNSFRHLSNFHIDISSLLAHNGNHDSSSPPHSGTLSITLCEQGISFLDGTNSVSTANSLTVSHGSGTIIINYNRISAMADGYFGAINYSNVVGSNSVNVVRR